jgi:hypothetical protein
MKRQVGSKIRLTNIHSRLFSTGQGFAQLNLGWESGSMRRHYQLFGVVEEKRKEDKSWCTRLASDVYVMQVDARSMQIGVDFRFGTARLPPEVGFGITAGPPRADIYRGTTCAFAATAS